MWGASEPRYGIINLDIIDNGILILALNKTFRNLKGFPVFHRIVPVSLVIHKLILIYQLRTNSRLEGVNIIMLRINYLAN